ncbi:MAG: hypothetical protein ACRDD1_21260 [Planctomycetia bacterium]
MGFERRGEAVAAALEMSELKLVYRALHEQLTRRPELLDTHFLIELQEFLHKQATIEGIDVADHAAWDTWLDEE